MIILLDKRRFKEGIVPEHETVVRFTSASDFELWLMDKFDLEVSQVWFGDCDNVFDAVATLVLDDGIVTNTVVIASSKATAQRLKVRLSDYDPAVVDGAKFLV